MIDRRPLVHCRHGAHDARRALLLCRIWRTVGMTKDLLGGRQRMAAGHAGRRVALRISASEVQLALIVVDLDTLR